MHGGSPGLPPGRAGVHQAWRCADDWGGCSSSGLGSVRREDAQPDPRGCGGARHGHRHRRGVRPCHGARAAGVRRDPHRHPRRRRDLDDPDPGGLERHGAPLLPRRGAAGRAEPRRHRAGPLHRRRPAGTWLCAGGLVVRGHRLGRRGGPRRPDRRPRPAADAAARGAGLGLVARRAGDGGARRTPPRPRRGRTADVRRARGRRAFVGPVRGHVGRAHHAAGPRPVPARGGTHGGRGQAARHARRGAGDPAGPGPHRARRRARRPARLGGGGHARGPVDPRAGRPRTTPCCATSSST